MSRIRQFYQNVKVIRLKGPEIALSAAATYPATTYVDVSNYKYVDVMINMGALTGTITWSLLENTASTGGTLDVIDATYAKATVATGNANKCAMFHLDTEHLASGHHYIAIKQTGGGAADYGDVLFFLHGAKSVPVSNPTATFPTALIKTLAG